MSPRSIRRAAERKARKLQRKQERLAAATHLPSAPEPSLEDEFSPELIAEARAVRERIAARLASHAQSAPQAPTQSHESPVPSSKTRAEINRANAAHSTGPVTSAGKLASSRNSFKHGLASGQLIIPGEDRTEFEALLQALLADHQPATATEEILIQEMAQSHWLTQRAIRLQNGCFTAEGLDEKRLALFLRYQTTHQRAFYKALHELVRLQKDRRRENPGFVSQTRAPIRRDGDEPAVLSEAKTQERVFVSQNNALPHSNSPQERCNTQSTHPPDNAISVPDWTF